MEVDLTRDARRLAVLSGPISKVKDGNLSAFTEARDRLEAEGWEVWSPRHHVLSDRCFSESQDRLANGEDPATGRYYRLLMRGCYLKVLQANAVFVLSGWMHASGAQREVLLAYSVGVPVFDYGSRALLRRLETGKLVVGARWVDTGTGLERLATVATRG